MTKKQMQKNSLNNEVDLIADSTAAPSTLEQAQQFCDRGWYNEALDVFSQLIDETTDDPVLLLEYGNTLFKKGDLKSAAAVFKKITVLKPDRVEGWNNLGIVQIQQGNTHFAHESFSHVLSLEPANTGALLNKGNCHFNDGEYSEALSYFEKACKVRADLPDGWYNMANSYIALKRFSDARLALERALRYCRDFPSALKNLGWVYEQEGRLSEAEQSYNEALLTQKSDAHLHINLGNVYVKQKRYDDAKKAYLKAIRLAPNELSGWMGLRGYALAKGDVGTFVRATTAVLGRLGEEVVAQSIEVLYELQQIDKADLILAQAERLGKKGPLLDVQRLLLQQRQGKDLSDNKLLLQRICAVENADGAIYRGLARYFLVEKEYGKSIEYAQKIEAPDGITQGIRWRALIAQGQLRETRREILAHTASQGASFDTFFLLADIEARRNNPKRAEVLLVYALDYGFCNMQEIHENDVLHKLFESMAEKRNAEESSE